MTPTPELPLLIDVESLPEALRKPIRKVSCAHFFCVIAAGLDNLPTPAVLAWLGVSETAYAFAGPRWEARVDAELTRENSAFDELYTELLGRALQLWSRPVPPLDTDVEAFISYQKQSQLAAHPGQLAARSGLTVGDEIRLTRLWQSRFHEPEIRAQAARALAAPPLPLPTLSPPPFSFPPRASAGQERAMSATFPPTMRHS